MSNYECNDIVLRISTEICRFTHESNIRRDKDDKNQPKLYSIVVGVNPKIIIVYSNVGSSPYAGVRLDTFENVVFSQI